MKNLILTAAVLLWPAIMVHAQPYALDWHKVAGGGASSAGGLYALTGTIGQADAGSMTGGNYSIMGGFWSFLSVNQTLVRPTLYLSYAGGIVSVDWQDVPGWILQENTDLTASAGWLASTGITTANGTNTLSLANHPGNRFFRLYKP